MCLIRFVLCLLSATLLISCASSEQTVLQEATSVPVEKQLITEYIADVPAENDTENRWLYGELSNQGTPAVHALADILTAPGTGDDMRARYALNGLAKYVSRPGAEPERRNYETGILRELQEDHTPTVKVFLMEQLELTGSDRAVPVLQSFLGDGELHESAVHALRAINTDQAKQALIQALPDIEEAQRAAVVKALGDLQANVAQEITPYVNDEQTQKATLYALAQSGDPAAENSLAVAVEKQYPQAETYYLLYAERLAEEGHSRESASISRDMLGSEYRSNIKSAALSALIKAEGEEALDDLIEAATSGDEWLRSKALSLLEQHSDWQIPDQWIANLDEQQLPVQADGLAMLGRSERASVSTLRPFLESGDMSVRLAAAQAMVTVGGANVLSDLLEALAETVQPEEIRQLKSVLLQMPTDPLVTGAAEALPSASDDTQIALIEVLAERRATQHLGTALNQLEGASDQVRLAVYKALERLATPDDLPQIVGLLPEAQNDNERSAIREAVVSISEEIPESEDRAEAVVQALNGAPDSQKPYLLEILPEIGGEEALKAITKAPRSSDKEVRSTALTALSGWPGSSAISPLLETLQEVPSSERGKILEGYIRLVKQSKYSAEDKVRFLNNALAEAVSAEEEVRILGAFSEIASPEALQAVANHFDDENESMREASLRSAARILSSSGEDTDQELSLIGATTSPENKEKITHYIQTLESSNGEADNFTALFNGEDLTGWIGDKESYTVRNGEGMNQPPDGFKALFNGESLEGWKGLVGDPESRAEMSTEELARKQQEADVEMQRHWSVRDGILHFDGEGHSLVTKKKYKDFEMMVDWKIEPGGDSGLYLRGTPQVQIWDITEWPQGSGGLYNNQKHPSEPLMPADNPIGAWNHMRIKMIDEKVTVHLNNQLVVDGVVLENYWDRNKPIYPEGQIELQSHSTPLYFKNIFIREIPRSEPLFNGEDLAGWQQVGADAREWHAEDKVLYTDGGGGWLSTAETYDNFKLELEYRLPEDGNSGIFLRAPREGNPAYEGLEIQLLDDYADQYADLDPWQYTGSIYNVKAPSKQASKKAGEWQKMEIVADGPQVKVILNGELIINTSLVNFMDRVDEHPGLKRRSGHIGLQNHNSRVEFRNITITEIK